RLVPLKNTEAAALATVLQKMMDARVQRQQSLGARDAEALRVIVLADDRSNSLIVGGSPESFQLVEDLASKLDVAEAALGGQVQLIPLTEANAGTLATTLAGLFDQRYQAARTPELRRQKPIILPDLRTNALLVAANADDSKVLRGLLEKLDVKLTDPAVQLVVIPLKHNDAGVVGPTIQQIFTARLASMTATGAKPSPQDRVDVTTDALSNAMIVSASKENLTLITGLLEKVDVEPPLESGLVKMYGLNFADAGRVASMLQSLLAKGLYKPGAAVAANAALAAREKVAIASDMRTNVLIVSASKENLAIIDEIVRRMDADVAPLLGDLRIYPLRHADATRLG
ncbi:MAG TPA: secretin N-terminal domain-containing protein, partial [Phycisphaerae bacterium]|nr:secretin N-terminal domain-containing protein [Phycisphaerae bacterium]